MHTVERDLAMSSSPKVVGLELIQAPKVEAMHKTQGRNLHQILR